MIYTLQYTDGTKLDVEFVDSTHTYRVDGRKVEGVTTVQSIIAKPELLQWAANMAVEAMENGVPASKAKYAHNAKKEAAGDVGSAVHAWIERFFEGYTDPYTPEMEPSIKGFYHWMEKYEPDTLFSEKIVYSREHDYAGKLDWGGVLGGRYGLVDFKTGSFDKQWHPYRKQYTGKVRARTEHFIQNAGYDIPLIEETGKPAEFYGVLYIQLDGTVEYFETEEVELMREAFLCTLNVKRAIKKVKSTNKYKERSSNREQEDA